MKKLTIVDIAKMAGVGTTTVSRYFNEYQPNMFELKSKMFLENIFREYITTTDITEEKKNKIDIINIFKKFKKQ